ncbi:hypothetical protein MKX03_019837 [Papaver bracteatum]|nr:hypothetical protein MKX03_019837 [Papaver bracteatum]
MMTEQQKIHPVADVEAPHPTAPLVNSRSARSEKGDPELQQQYAPRRNIPVYHSKPPKKRRGCCCKCICWTISFNYTSHNHNCCCCWNFYAVFQPKLPKSSEHYYLRCGVKGQTPNASDLLSSLRTEQQTTEVPLNLRVKVPVKIKLGKLKLWKIKFMVSAIWLWII